MPTESEDLEAPAVDPKAESVLPPIHRAEVKEGVDARCAESGGATLLIARDPSRIADLYGIPDALGPWEGQLANGGENIRIVDVLRNPDDQLDKQMFDTEVRGKTDRVVYRFRRP